MPDIGINIDDFTQPFEGLSIEKENIYISELSTPITGNEEGLAKLVELYNEFRLVVEAYRELLRTDVNAISDAAEKMLNTDDSLTTYFEVW
jgi:hypothetical protein